jgi:hypothetical protein
MKRSLMLMALAVLCQLSCSGSQPAAPSGTPSQQQLSITGLVTLGEVNPSVQLTLLSGSQDVTNSATCQSSNTSVATVSLGLVRATGVGTTTVNASYQGRTVSSQMSAIADQDCIPYDPSNVSTMPATKDPSQLLITAPDPFGRSQLSYPTADGLIDAGDLVALYRR